MDTNKMRDISREQFEQTWCYAMRNDEGVPAARPLRSLVDPEKYRGSGVNAAWYWWQASRAAVVLELPAFDDYPASMERDMQQSLRAAIEAQGLKCGVKP